jgi:hypothetical protein
MSDEQETTTSADDIDAEIVIETDADDDPAADTDY